MKKILVTGGAGFIGSHLVEHFQQQAEVVVMDIKWHPSLNGLRCQHVCESIIKRTAVRAAMQGVDTVFHLAALTSVDESMSRPFDYLKTNTVGTLIVLEEAQRAGVKKFVYSSTAAVYGNRPMLLCDETDCPAPAPVSTYAVSKLAGEHYCQMLSDRMSVVCLRYFNVFGPRQSSSYAAVIPSIIKRALRNDPVEIHGDGEQTRDFIHVGNVVAVNALAAKPEVTGIVNVGLGWSISINMLAQDILTITGSSSPIKHTDPRPGDVRHSTALVGRLYGDLGFKTVVPYGAGLLDTVTYFRDLYTKGLV